LCELISESKTTNLTSTATSLERLNLSADDPGYMAAHISVNNDDVDDSTFTTPTSVSCKAIWYA
jgi:hypothetical protein